MKTNEELLVVKDESKIAGKVTFSIYTQIGSGIKIATKIKEDLDSTRENYRSEMGFNSFNVVIENVTVNVPNLKYEERAVRIVARNYDSKTIELVRRMINICLPYYVSSPKNIVYFDCTKMINLEEILDFKTVADCGFEEKSNVSFFKFKKRYYLSKLNKKSKDTRYSETVRYVSYTTKEQLLLLPVIMKKIFEDGNNFRTYGRKKKEIRMQPK